MKIAKNEKKYISKCQALVRDLPSHFQTNVMDALTADLHSDLVYTALDDTKQRVFGFLCLRRTNAHAAEISWWAVAGQNWNAGSAAALLERAATDAKGKGARLMTYKTLHPDTGYEPFMEAWGFLEKKGFVPVASIEPFPGWEPGQPCAIMVKIL